MKIWAGSTQTLCSRYKVRGLLQGRDGHISKARLGVLVSPVRASGFTALLQIPVFCRTPSEERDGTVGWVPATQMKDLH